jgi:signal peptidase I
MANEQTISNLEMASTSSLPLRAVSVPFAAPQPKVSGYQLMRFFQNLGTLLLIAVLCLLAYMAVSGYFVRSVKVVGNSMVPTLQPGGSYLLNVWAFHNQNPHRGDIVVIRDPGDHGLSVKRVIAAGGDSIHFKDGQVYVNGKLLDEPYLLPNTRTFTYTHIHEKFIACAPDQYFVLGDNRQWSIDSRAYGPVSREGVLGLVEAKSK